jgi:hypothetical protein
MKTLVTFGVMATAAVMVAAGLVVGLQNSAYALAGCAFAGCSNNQGSFNNGYNNNPVTVGSNNGGNTGNIHTGNTGGEKAGNIETGSSAVGNNQGNTVGVGKCNAC